MPSSLPVNLTPADGLLSVSAFFANPSRITQRVYELSFGDVLLTRFFNVGGLVTGGAMIVSETEPGGWLPERDVQLVQPASEFPVITSSEMVPIVAPVEKWGGKIWISDEAKARNDASQFTNDLLRLANAVTRAVNQRAMEVLDEAFVRFPTQVIDVTAGAGVAWDTLVPDPVTGMFPVNPFVDVLNAQALVKAASGLRASQMLLNPADALILFSLYGPAWREGFVDIDGQPLTVITDDEVTPGTALIYPEGGVGEVRFEKGLFTETWREPETERNWAQTSIRPAMAVINPGGIVRLVGIST